MNDRRVDGSFLDDDGSRCPRGIRADAGMLEEPPVRRTKRTLSGPRLRHLRARAELLSWPTDCIGAAIKFSILPAHGIEMSIPGRWNSMTVLGWDDSAIFGFLIAAIELVRVAAVEDVVYRG